MENAHRWAYLYDSAAERASKAASKIRQLEKRVCQLEQELAMAKKPHYPKWDKRSKMAERPGDSWASFEGPLFSKAPRCAEDPGESWRAHTCGIAGESAERLNHLKPSSFAAAGGRAFVHGVRRPWSGTRPSTVPGCQRQVDHQIAGESGTSLVRPVSLTRSPQRRELGSHF